MTFDTQMPGSPKERLFDEIDNMLHLVADLLTAVFTHIISYL